MAGGGVVKSEWPRTALPLNSTFELRTILPGIPVCYFSWECSYQSQTEADERSWLSLSGAGGWTGWRKTTDFWSRCLCDLFGHLPTQYYCRPYFPQLLINLQNCMMLIMLLLDIMLAIVHSSHFMHKQLLTQLYCLPPLSFMYSLWMWMLLRLTPVRAYS